MPRQIKRETGIPVPWLIYLFILCVPLSSLLISGCGDDPTRPRTTPDPSPGASTPDSLMLLFKEAIGSMDFEMYAGLFALDCECGFTYGDIVDHDLENESLNREELLLAARNLFSGEPVENWRQEPVPPATEIQWYRFEATSDWSYAKHDPQYSGLLHIQYYLRFLVRRSDGDPHLVVFGKHDFYVEFHPDKFSEDPPDSLPRGTYRFAGMVPVEPFALHHETRGFEDDSWGGMNLRYLSNAPPQAQLEVKLVEGAAPYGIHGDAGESTDPDGGLHARAFRWRFDDDGEWTDWNTKPEVTHVYDQPGEYKVTVEVRDRWRACSEAVQTITVK